MAVNTGADDLERPVGHMAGAAHAAPRHVPWAKSAWLTLASMGAAPLNGF
jgi:hypothetical protein